MFAAPVEVDSIDSYETEEHDYTNIRIDTDGLKAEDTNQPYVAHVQNDGAHLQQVSGAAGLIWALTRENLSSGVCEQQRCRPACTSVQSDQRLCYYLIAKYHI